MWLPGSIIAEVRRVARIHYVDVETTRAWNAQRHDGELRLLTGWCWTARNGRSFRQGFKTRTVAMRDAWYSLISNSEAPPLPRPRKGK
jgi:hypothetical protein